MSRAATGGVEVNSTARWPERLEQVATDRFQAQENPLTNIVAQNFAEVQDYLSLSAHQQNSNLVIIGGRPGMGKTSLALGIASHAAMDVGAKVLVFSLEMSERELGQRLLAAEAPVLRLAEGTLVVLAVRVLAVRVLAVRLLGLAEGVRHECPPPLLPELQTRQVDGFTGGGPS
mgnify:CR=1 FL=1